MQLREPRVDRCQFRRRRLLCKRHAGACARLPPDLFCEVLRQQRIAAAKQQLLHRVCLPGRLPKHAQGKIALAGIAKRLDEIYFPGDSVPLYIDKNSETLRVVQRLRDEAHRFCITHHRQQRSKSQIHSRLDEIPGIGPKTRDLLLRKFKSIKRMGEATVEELAEVVGPKKAEVLHKALNVSEISE